MAVPAFRYQPKIQEILQSLPSVADDAVYGPMSEMVEALYRRDRQLEDWLKNFGGGREYATVVIAAADSHRDGKNKANFVCTGTNDHLVWQKAIDSLPTTSFGVAGRIEALEGVYHHAGSVTTPAGSIIVVSGQSKSTTAVVPTTDVPLFILGAGSALEVWDMLIFDFVTSTAATFSAGSGTAVTLIDSGVYSPVAAISGPTQAILHNSLVTGSMNLLSLAAVDSQFGVVTGSAMTDCVVSGCTITATSSGYLFDATFPSTGFQSSITTSTIANTGTGGELRLTGSGGGVTPALVGNLFGRAGATAAKTQHVVALVGGTESPIVHNTFFSISGGSSDHVNLSGTGSGVGVNHNNFKNSGRYNVNVSAGTVSTTNTLYNVYGTGGLNDSGTGTVTTIPAASVPPIMKARKNSTGSTFGGRTRLNFIEGSNITLTVADDSVDDEIDVTVAGATPTITVRKNSGSNVGTRPRINFIEGSNITLTVGDDGSDNEVDVTIAAAASTDIPTDIQTFAANGTWTKPSAGQTRARVIIIGGGGGGGSGRRGAAGSARGGGGAGGGGGYVEFDIPLSALAATQAVVCGAAGTAGAGITTDSTNGSAGTAGAASSIAGYSAGGGGAGAGGTTSVGAVGATGSGLHAAGAGGAGGGIDAANSTTSSATGSTSAWSRAGGAGG